jgi:hypothetical protein
VQIEESAMIQSEFRVIIHPTSVQEISNTRIELLSHKLQSITEQKVALKWKTPNQKCIPSTILQNSGELNVPIGFLHLM